MKFSSPISPNPDDCRAAYGSTQLKSRLNGTTSMDWAWVRRIQLSRRRLSGGPAGRPGHRHRRRYLPDLRVPVTIIKRPRKAYIRHSRRVQLSATAGRSLCRRPFWCRGAVMTVSKDRRSSRHPMPMGARSGAMTALRINVARERVKGIRSGDRSSENQQAGSQDHYHSATCNFYAGTSQLNTGSAAHRRSML